MDKAPVDRPGPLTLRSRRVGRIGELVAGMARGVKNSYGSSSERGAAYS